MSIASPMNERDPGSTGYRALLAGEPGLELSRPVAGPAALVLLGVAGGPLAAFAALARNELAFGRRTLAAWWLAFGAAGGLFAARTACAYFLGRGEPWTSALTLGLLISRMAGSVLMLAGHALQRRPAQVHRSLGGRQLSGYEFAALAFASAAVEGISLAALWFRGAVPWS